MKGKRILAVICILLLLCTICFLWHRHKMLNRVMDHQPMRIMVDGKIYTHGGGIKQEKPEGPPDGTILEIIDSVTYPQKDGQANFGPVGTPYWYYGSKIVVQCDKYRIFD